MRGKILFVAGFVTVLPFLGCTAHRGTAQHAPERVQPRSSELSAQIREIAREPLSAEERELVVETAAENFAYGRGLGDTAMNVAGVLLYPPYGALLLGQALLDVSGVGRVRAVDLLPEKEQETYETALAAISSAPGRAVSYAAGKPFRDEQMVGQVWDETLRTVRAGQARRRTGARAPVAVQPRFFGEEQSADREGAVVPLFFYGPSQ
ncbi:hypothetical protein MRY87_03060 [bacterium]|nr:hypothetical protein [bacterium]